MTSAQRARLVVALGVLNLVLATLALAVGISTPTQPIPGVAAAPSSTPAGPVSLPPAETPLLRTPSPAPTEPATPSASATPEATPTSEPSSIPVPTGVVIVANRPPATPDPTAQPTTPAATLAATPDPTARPNPTDPPKPTPAAKPPPKPTPTPKPAAKPQAHPPCPGAVDGPPGHNKGQPWEKPCGEGNGGGNGNGGDKGNGNAKGGVIIVLPLALTAAALGGRRRIADTLRRRPSAR